MHHYTVHTKMGIAKECLDEFDQRLRDHDFDVHTASALLFIKLLDGFFTNLIGALDNLTQELNLIYDLGLREDANFSHLLETGSASQKRVENGRKLPTDGRLSNLLPVITRPELSAVYWTIGTYRKNITHRKLVSSLTSERARVNIIPARVGSGGATPSSSSAPPTVPVAKTHSGGMTFEVTMPLPPSGSLHRLNEGAWAKIEDTPLSIKKDRAIFILPKKDKLNLLPTETKEEDLDTREIVDICQEIYRQVIEFMGRLYEVMVSGFHALP